jgi:hypothetical protein
MFIQARDRIVNDNDFICQIGCLIQGCKEEASARVFRSPALSVLRKDGSPLLSSALDTGTGVLFINIS